MRDGVLTGGAAKGQLWPQIVADTLGIPLRIPVVEESTALGAAICAGVGAGFWKGTDEGAASVAAFARTVEPDARSACHLPGSGRPMAQGLQQLHGGSRGRVAEAALARRRDLTDRAAPFTTVRPPLKPSATCSARSSSKNGGSSIK